MKNLFTVSGLALVMLLGAGAAAQAQTATGGVRIGTAGTPDASAVLDLVSGTKGALLPRVAALADVASPATGLIVYQTGGTPGYYYYTGTAWQQLATTTGTVSTASNGLTKTGQNVALGGALTAATTIAQVGNTFSLTGGNVGIGTAAPQSTLEVSGDFRVSSGVVNAALGTTGPGNANISGGALGQSFTMPVAGTVTSVRLVAGNNSFSTTFQIYAGSGNVGAAQLASPQPISFTANTTTTVPLATPVALAAGTYTLVINTGSNNLLYFNSGDRYAGGNIYQGTASLGTADLDFTIAYSSGTATSAFSVGTSGNVGIGTSTAPSQKLEVAGGSVKISTAGQGLIFADGSTQTTAAAPATGSGSYIQNTTSPQAGSSFNVSGSGNVGTSLGVGTSGAPVATLDVRGSQALAYVTTGSTSGTFTLTAAHHTVRRFGPCNNISIPDASTCAGRIYVIISSNGAGSNVGLSVQSGGPIYDDVANSVITFIGSGERLSIQSDGAGWIVIGR